MSDKIRVKFWRFDKLVVIRVLNMPAKYRGKERIAVNGEYMIISAMFPELYDKSLYLCGTNIALDKRYGAHNYETEEEAKAAIDAFRGMIRKLNEDGCEYADESMEPEVITAE